MFKRKFLSDNFYTFFFNRYNNFYGNDKGLGSDWTKFGSGCPNKYIGNTFVLCLQGMKFAHTHLHDPIPKTGRAPKLAEQ